MVTSNFTFVAVLGFMTLLAACNGGKSSSRSASSELENGVAIIGGSSGGSGGIDSQNEDTATSGGEVVDSSDSDDETIDNEDVAAGNASGGTIGQNNPDQPSSLEGAWIKACVLIDPSDTDIGYRIWTLTFEGSRFSSYIRNFTTPGCTSASAIYSQVIFQGHFEVKEVTTSSEGLNVQQINVFTQTPVESVEFDIFYIDDNHLYFGDTSGLTDGTAIGNRPSSLDFYWDLIKSE